MSVKGYCHGSVEMHEHMGFHDSIAMENMGKQSEETKR